MKRADPEQDVSTIKPLTSGLLNRHQLLLERYRRLIKARSRSESLGRFAMHHAQEGIALIRESGVVSNRSFSRLCGRGLTWMCLSDPTLAEVRSLPNLLIKQGQAVLKEVLGGAAPEARRLLFRSCGPAPQYLDALMRNHPEMKPPQISVTLRSATEAAALQQQKDENRQRDEFLAMLAHELRNPLAPIATSAELILRTAAEPRIQRWAQLIQRQVQHEARLVSELLDTARVRQGKITLRLVPVELRALLREAVVVTDTERGERVRLHLRLTPAPVWVEADATRLLQCLVNLLHNAVKFIEGPGEIWLELSVGDSLAWVRVRDTGIGISREMLSTIFGLFVQAEQPLDRSRGGLGLGLALTKALIERQQGGVRAVSEGLGRGAEFTIWLPLRAAPAESAAPQEVVLELSMPQGVNVEVLDSPPDLRE